MITRTAAVCCCSILYLLCGASSAAAQSDLLSGRRCEAAPSMRQLFGGTIENLRALPSRDTIGIAAIGGLAALSARAADRDVRRDFTVRTPAGDPFKPGAVIGGTAFALSAGVATYAIARAVGKPCAASLGADLVQAELMSEALVFGIKEATKRSRPEGSGYSFPSGHTTVAFASATVLQRHFGWKVGVPAYAVAAYVGASRVEMKRHYLSDVAFGAALGIAAGRTIPMGRSHGLMLTPIVSDSGAGAGFSWVGRK
jgi:membrane-associated phospholipid phosphatase